LRIAPAARDRRSAGVRRFERRAGEW